MKLQLVHICLITNNYHTLLLNLLLWHVPLDILSYHLMGVKVVVGGAVVMSPDILSYLKQG